MSKVWIHFAENNELGNPSGKCAMICTDDEEGETALTLLSKYISQKTGQPDGILFSRYIGKEGKTVKIHRRYYPYISCREWVGNMCWNAYKFEVETALEIYEYLRKTAIFHCEDGFVEIFSKWDKPDLPLLASDFGWPEPETQPEPEPIDPNQLPLF